MPTPSPVVIIPGYYGTLLIDRAAHDRTVWLTLQTLLHSGELLDAINLETGDPDRIVSGDILEEVPILGHWAPNVYKGLRMLFGTFGMPPEDVIAFGVDWRRSLGFNVDQLHDKISRIGKISPSGKVNLVAHSHGGLVAREYLRAHGGDLVDNLITLGSPHKGMHETLRALVGKKDFFGWSKSHLMKTARTFPSAYELLPLDPADGLFEWDGAPAEPFTNNGWAGPAMRPKLADAAGMLGNLPGDLPVKSAMIFGTHLPTTVLASGGAAQQNLTFTVANAGDGTVPTVSASGNGLTGDHVERYAIPYGVHAHLFEYEAAQTIMRNILFDRPMAHFACGFSSLSYRAGQLLGVGVDLRGPGGVPFPDGAVQITIGGKTIDLPHDPAAGDFFVELKMPNSSQHLQYKVTASSTSLSKPFTQVGVIFSLNH